MHFLFDDPYEPIKEGPVKIQFEKSNGHIKVTYTVDFAKTNLSAHKAGNLQKAIVALLRTGLGVELSKCK